MSEETGNETLDNMLEREMGNGHHKDNEKRQFIGDTFKTGN